MYVRVCVWCRRRIFAGRHHFFGFCLLSHSLVGCAVLLPLLLLIRLVLVLALPVLVLMLFLGQTTQQGIPWSNRDMAGYPFYKDITSS